jgi:hypothetical protein
MDLKERECVDWIKVDQNTVQWRAAVNKVMEYARCIEGGSFFNKLNDY